MNFKGRPSTKGGDLSSGVQFARGLPTFRRNLLPLSSGTEHPDVRDDRFFPNFGACVPIRCHPTRMLIEFGWLVECEEGRTIIFTSKRVGNSRIKKTAQ
jgi:hypothetical protein